MSSATLCPVKKKENGKKIYKDIGQQVNVVTKEVLDLLPSELSFE